MQRRVADVRFFSSFHHSITPPSHHPTTPPPHHSITPSLHHSITPSLHHSTTPFRKKLRRCRLSLSGGFLSTPAQLNLRSLCLLAITPADFRFPLKSPGLSRPAPNLRVLADDRAACRAKVRT